MKYISLAFILACLAFTWKLSSFTDPVGLVTHHDIQTDLAKIIEGAVTQQLPEAQNFIFQTLYTETLSENSVKANFAYSFTDTTGGTNTDRSIHGTALVNRDPTNPTKWSLDQIQVDQSTIEFEEGLVITAGEEPPK